MPFHLKRKGELYFVVDDKGKKYSDNGLSKERAMKQMISLNILQKRKEARGGEYIPLPTKKEDEDCKPKVPQIKASDCIDSCKTGKLRGNLVVLNDTLKKLLVKPPNLVSQSLPTISVPPSMRGLAALKQEPGFSIGVAPKKKELTTDSVSMGVAPKKKIEGFEGVGENVLVQPKRAGRPVKVITPDLAGALSSDKMSIKEAAITGMKSTEWKYLNAKRRKGVYETIKKGEFVPPSFMRRGYEGWLKKQK